MAPTEEHLFRLGQQPAAAAGVRGRHQGVHAAGHRPGIRGRPPCTSASGIAQYSRGQYEDAVKSFLSAARSCAGRSAPPTSFLGEMYGVAPAIGEEITRRLARFAKAQPRNAQAQFHYAMSLWKGPARRLTVAGPAAVEGLLGARSRWTSSSRRRFSSSAFCSRTSSGIRRRFRSCGTPRGSRPTWRRRTTACRRRINGPVRRSWRRKSSSCSGAQWVDENVGSRCFSRTVCSGPAAAGVRPCRIMISAIFIVRWPTGC
jgi:hypothetical protein